ncbi:GntR family transcriptional regulator [Hespellia stercorisuis]|uniref:GntR family transcriptional regulator n=1 Tax=Hespellia stercorisuis DSM 15480 TaxID=1121950 RepID=A0A1M6JV18_9FIRM|nr:GntR family transcriptional regulator [Hespellia stercorisuis]SHJ50526.1 GntR family transcriptional regulator [Hespellia stercorisuis DSM 15480]
MKQNWSWETIADSLIQDFQKKVYDKGEKMPSENKLAARFGVPRSEIRKAYERLKELGYVYSMQGYGSFFSGKREKIRLSMSDESFSKKLSAMNVSFETRNLGCRKLHDDSLIQTMLGLDSDEAIYKITRLRILNDEPIAIHTSYLPLDLFPTIREDGKTITSLYDYMHSCGYLNLHSENVQLTVSSLKDKERTLLNIKGYAPSLILTERCVSLPSGIILQVARTVYRSDKFIFEL